MVRGGNDVSGVFEIIEAAGGRSSVLIAPRGWGILAEKEVAGETHAHLVP